MDREIKEFLETVPEAEIFRDTLRSPFYVLAEGTPESPGPVAVYETLDGEKFILVVHENDWDEQGWVDNSGFPLRQRLQLAGYHRTGHPPVWARATVGVIWDIHRWEVEGLARIVHPRDIHPVARFVKVDYHIKDEAGRVFDKRGRPVLTLLGGEKEDEA